MSFLGLFLILIAASPTFAQAISPDVRPTPLVRLTGTLEIDKDAPPSTLPVLRVWIDDHPHSLAVVARYLVHIGRGQQGPPLFLIQEANIPVREEDRLYPAAVMERVS